jgi:hypothetical protein
VLRPVVEFRIRYWQDRIAAVPGVWALRERERNDRAVVNGACATIQGELALNPDVSHYQVGRVRLEVEHAAVYARIAPELAGGSGRVLLDRLLEFNGPRALPRGRAPASVALIGESAIPVEYPPGELTLADGTRVRIVPASEASGSSV